MGAFSAWCARNVRLLDLVQNTCLLAAIVAGLGSGASFLAAHVDLQNLQQTTEGMVEALRDEIVIATQLSTTAQDPVFLLPGQQARAAPEVTPDPAIDRARGHLHNATLHWAERDYGRMRQNLTAGYGELGADVPLLVPRHDLLAGRVKCLRLGTGLDPKDIDPVKKADCLLEVPRQAFNLGLVAAGAGLACAVTAALSAPGTGRMGLLGRRPQIP